MDIYEEYNPKILIVDDTPMNIHVLINALKDDYQIMVAKNGEKALKIAVANTPDLILLDVMMPDIDGFEVCRRLKSNEKTKKIPVIFVTAMIDSVDEAKGLNLGAIDYITKPVHLPVAKARINNHIRLKRNTDMLEELVSIDGLLGIPNRRKFDEAITMEWIRAKRSSLPLSLILMDIDFFKQYNDHYGHAVGDECLKKVAHTINETIRRPMDLAARYGGEEFVAMLPETSLEGALYIAKKIRSNIEILNISHEYSNVSDHVTISLGVSSIIPDENQTHIVLIEQADAALYKAKEEGRNSLKAYQT
ncbi:MAG: PleD family two-component system response regulator [Desulfobacterales bacterium]|nr:PleD family two-component system response regulator [Desulfobacterales bacterium]